MRGTEPASRIDLPFIAELRPYRSLGPRGFLVLMTFISLVAFVAGIIFMRAGAWPVLGFFGLDVVLIYIANLIRLCIMTWSDPAFQLAHGPMGANIFDAVISFIVLVPAFTIAQRPDNA